MNEFAITNNLWSIFLIILSDPFMRKSSQVWILYQSGAQAKDVCLCKSVYTNKDQQIMHCCCIIDLFAGVWLHLYRGGHKNKAYGNMEYDENIF